MSKCKVIEKCKKCQCCKKQAVGLSEQLAKPRPVERVIERQIVELATRCEECGCKGETNANQRS